MMSKMQQKQANSLLFPFYKTAIQAVNNFKGMSLNTIFNLLKKTL